MKPTTMERLAAKTHIGDGGCWTWVGSHVGGYGRSFANGKKIMAHRLSYELFVGEVASHLTVDHLCKNRLCINPLHLELVSAIENVRRGQQRTKCGRCGSDLRRASDGNPICGVCRDGKDRRYREMKSRGVEAIPSGDRTHCPDGHPYSEENTYVSPRGRRWCRTCRRAQDLARKDADRKRILGVRAELDPTPDVAMDLMRQLLAARPAQVSKNDP